VETFGFLNNNVDASIIITTDTLSVGWNSCYTCNVVLIGEPDNIKKFVQKIKCVGQDSKAVPSSCITLKVHWKLPGRLWLLVNQKFWNFWKTLSIQ